MSDNDGLLSAHERRPRASVCLYTTVYDSGSLNPSTSSLRASVFEFDVRRPVAVQSRDQTGSTHQPEPPYSKRPSLSAGSRLPARLVGVEYMVHLRYIWRKKIGRTRSSAARVRERAAPAAMPPPTEAREGCSGLVGEACARQLDGGVDGRRPPYRRR